MSNTNASNRMFLRFDRTEHAFARPTDASAPEATDLLALIALAEGDNHGRRFPQRFNDLHQYLSLGNAEIRKISVYHNDFCLGIKTTYSRNGRLKDRMYHYDSRNRGYFTWTWSGGPPRKSAALILDDDEYLCEVRTRQGDITDQITFCTNKRTVSVGGMGGSADPRDVSNIPVDLTKRVVAFVGTFSPHGGLGRFGTVSILRNWEIIREFVLLRELVDRERDRDRSHASPVPSVNRGQVVQREEFVLQELMNVDASIFRRVLSFLIANVETEQV